MIKSPENNHINPRSAVILFSEDIHVIARHQFITAHHKVRSKDEKLGEIMKMLNHQFDNESIH